MQTRPGAQGVWFPGNYPAPAHGLKSWASTQRLRLEWTAGHRGCAGQNKHKIKS